jgi:hypothetical protein
MGAGILVIVAAAVAFFVMFPNGREEQSPPSEVFIIDDPALLDDLHLDLADEDPTTWVRSYLPEESSSGYNLVLYRRRLPMLIDMNGRVVHVWPKVRAVSRVRLDREGRLAVIGTDNLVKEYDWEGNLLWHFRLQVEGDFPHHDLIKLRSGNYLVLARDLSTRTGYLVEVDPRGEVVWEWRSTDHIEEFPKWDRESRHPTHLNSMSELPANQWFAAGDDRFRPGNILVSARNLDTIFIIDKATGKVVWQYFEGLDQQHEAVMIEQGETGEGLITLFNNGYKAAMLSNIRRSTIQMIDPVRNEVVWSYGSDFFFSRIAGVAQKLQGESFQVVSSQGGRIFEIAADGKIVWEWVPPFMPMRDERIPYDHCPQLAAIGEPTEIEITTDETRPYVDMDLYRFAFSDDIARKTIAGRKRKVLKWQNGCQELLIPPDASLIARFGYDEERLEGGRLKARFRLTAAERGDSPATLFDATLSSDSIGHQRERRRDLEEFAFKWVTMCVSTEAEGAMEDPLALVYWSMPVIRSWSQHPKDERPGKEISEQERRLRKQQLEALGYVD